MRVPSRRERRRTHTTVREDIRLLELRLQELSMLMGPKDQVRLAVEKTVVVVGGVTFWLVALVMVPVVIANGFMLGQVAGAMAGVLLSVAGIAGASMLHDRVRRLVLERAVERAEQAPEFHALSSGSSMAVPTDVHLRR